MAGRIRVAAIADASAICEIYNYYIEKSTATFETRLLRVEEMARRIENIVGTFPYYVWENESKVVGYCYAHLWKERAAYANTWETTVYVAPEATGKGIGIMLMQQLIEDCRQRGAHSLIACITAENEASVSMHSKLGFMKVSHFKEVGLKDGRLLDVVDLQLLL